MTDKIPLYVKKSFECKERMWIKVVSEVKDGYLGFLSNKPVVITSVKQGDEIFVPKKEIVDVIEDEDELEFRRRMRRNG